MQTDIKNTPSAIVIFEHPLNEHIRVSMRLENLFLAIDQNLPGDSPEHSKKALVSLLRILNVIDRPDLKSKLVQTLNQLANNLGQLEHFPQVDPKRLQHILSQLHHFVKQLHAARGKLAESLRQIDFLNQIKLHLNNPAGICEHTLPAYKLWLALPKTQRQHDLEHWLAPLKDLQNIIYLVLSLLRHSTSPKHVQCKQGYYQQDLDPTTPCELLRVGLSSDQQFFPEFSTGKHRINIRMMKPDFKQGNKPKQINDNVAFMLTCCRL